MNISKRIRILAALVGGGIVVASSACSVDSVAPTSAPRSLSPSVRASAASGPSQAGSLTVASSQTFPDMSRDGTYNVDVDPTVDNVLTFGNSRLEVPAGSMCAVGSSSYGPAYWDTPCAPQTHAVTLSITVNSTSGAGASVDFNPALRFSPLSKVVLTLSAPSVSQQDAKNWLILYCPSSTSTTSGKGSGGSGGGKDANKCVNEALTDKDLQTFVDYDLKQLFRRIKHFSLYTVSDGSGYTLSE
jgi:hypothetical protein